MNQPALDHDAGQNVAGSPPAAPVVRTWRTRGRLLGMPISLLAIWAALFVAASAIPALPVPGMAGMITINAILSAISGVILGPAAAVANAAGGIIGMILFPYGAFFGPLSFLTVTLGGLVSGLTFSGRWKLALLVELLIIGSWFVNPQSWQQLMWIVPLPYSAVTLLVICVGPLREWARRQVLTLNKRGIWPAMFLLAATAHSPEYLTSNSLTNWMFNLRWQFWVPTWPYWTAVSTVILLLATVVGVAVVTGLSRARLPHASDLYLDKTGGK